MYRDSYYDKIMNKLRAMPMSQNEIYRKFKDKKDKITLQGVAKHLNQGVSEGVILYLGNKVNKKDARYFLRYKFGRLWPFNAWQCYVYTPQSEKFYLKLKKTPNIKNEQIKEILELYRRLEFSAMYYDLEYYNFKIVKSYMKRKGNYINDDSVREKIARDEKKVNDFFNKKSINHKVSEFLGLTPMMYWCAFKRLMPTNHPEYDASKEVIEIVTKPLIEKLNSVIKSV